MENKKTKLTISGNPKKTFKNFESTKTQGKKTVIIEKKSNKTNFKNNLNKPLTTKTSSNFKKNISLKTNLGGKIQSSPSDFERRKLAEQRATKRLKNDLDNNKEKKTKLGTKKRELKLTVSRALSDEIETRERSLASVKRARQKELKNSNKDENKESLTPVKRDINIPEAITVRELANRMAEQLNFAIREGGRTVGAGVVTKIIE